MHLLAEKLIYKDVIVSDFGMIDKLYKQVMPVKNSARGKRYLFFNSWRKG
jgi:hypothetical protein